MVHSNKPYMARISQASLILCSSIEAVPCLVLTVHLNMIQPIETALYGNMREGNRIRIALVVNRFIGSMKRRILDILMV
jgi:Na+-transporting methylmalonyl-CoA/oxaloacetate decarboxylase beta subunit